MLGARGKILAVPPCEASMIRAEAVALFRIEGSDEIAVLGFSGRVAPAPGVSSSRPRLARMGGAVAVVSTRLDGAGLEALRLGIPFFPQTVLALVRFLLTLKERVYP